MPRRGSSRVATLGVRDRLQLYMEQLAELGRRRLFQEGIDFNFAIKYEAPSGTLLTLDQPDEDSLRAYLVSLRPFILNDEAVHLYSVYRLCWRHVRSSELRWRLASWRTKWKQVDKTAGGLRVVIDDEELISAEVFDVWVNAIFHVDVEKRQRLAAMDGIDAMLFRQVFGNFIVRSTIQIIELSWIVEDALRDDLVEESAPG